MLTGAEIEQLVQQCPSSYFPINYTYLYRTIEVVSNMVEVYSRVFAMRVDLHFAKETLESDVDSLICLQRSDSGAITRFFESLKSQLREDHIRSNRRGEPVLPAYIWCREQESSVYPHYHVVLLFYKDHYAFMGDYTQPDADNMGVRIIKAWCSALGLEYPDYSHLVHFAAKGRYWIYRSSVQMRDPMYLQFLTRIAYLSKQATKISDGNRNFGTSQVNLLGI